MATAGTVPWALLFDYFDLSSGAFGFALGDVAGKGPPAALLTCCAARHSCRARLRGRRARRNSETRQRITRPSCVESRFATLLYGVLSHDGRLTYCNAGHNPPVLMGRHGVQRLEKGGVIVGAFKQASFEEEALQLESGDTLVVFSDGLSEALNPDDDEFGEERLLSCVQANRELTPSDLLQCLLDTVHRFTAGAAQSDDLTVLVLRYLGT